MECKLGDVQANLDKALHLVEKTANMGADIICLPEMCSTGYNLDLLGEKIYNLVEPLEGTFMSAMRSAAKSLAVHLIVPFAEKRDHKKIYNTAVVIDPQGEVLGSSSKVHLFEAERNYFQPGNDYVLFEFATVSFGIMICYDAGFPEVARTFALRGATLLFLPAAWRIQDEAVWDLNTRQRALENNLFLCAVNRVGEEGSLHMFGKSKIVDPWGEVIAEAVKDQEDCLIAQLNLDQITKAREYYAYLQERRPETYSQLVSVSKGQRT
jgi:predicted amidohydrolase